MLSSSAVCKRGMKKYHEVSELMKLMADGEDSRIDKPLFCVVV